MDDIKFEPDRETGCVKVSFEGKVRYISSAEAADLARQIEASLLDKARLDAMERSARRLFGGM